MHDLMFSKEIITAIRNKTQTIGSDKKIAAVNVRLSALSHVKPDTLNETFSLMTKDTPYSDIRLIIKELSLNLSCMSCKNEFTAEEPTFECPKCRSNDINIVCNKEFDVEAIEICDNKRTDNIHVENLYVR